MTHAELIDYARRWLGRPWRNATPEGHGACATIITELTTAAMSGERPDALGWSGGHSILIECKAARADFCRDRKKLFRKFEEMGVGRQRYYMAPVDEVTVEDLPARWGLLLVHRNRRISVAQASDIFSPNLQCEISMLLSVIRRQRDDIARLMYPADHRRHR